jgi:poly-gamma-glutamate synthesis protein (capsule biosynthesis protein)
MLAGSATAILDRQGYDLPFAATRSILSNSHITIGNLEAPITGRGSGFSDKRFRFRSRPEAARALKDAGFTVLTLANNHILDYGAIGLSDTLSSLDCIGISYCGAGKNLTAARTPGVIKAQGVRVAFLAYSLTYPAEFFAGTARYGTAPGHASLFVEDIRSARKGADYVVVSFHWGRELNSSPQQYQVAAARSAIDAGADLVLGHHPHVLQGIERYRNGLIFYSLGNFAFGSRSVASDRSIIARINLDQGVKEAEIIPLNVLNREVGFQPVPLKGKKGRDVIERLNTLSTGRGVRIAAESGRYLLKWDNGTVAKR